MPYEHVDHCAASFDPNLRNANVNGLLLEAVCDDQQEVSYDLVLEIKLASCLNIVHKGDRR
jgi:hypothetical protein